MYVVIAVVAVAIHGAYDAVVGGFARLGQFFNERQVTRGNLAFCRADKMHFRSFEEFWPFYVNQHTKASTRRWHFCATGSATLFFIAAIAIKWWLLFFAPVVGYGLAWYSHFFIEGNTPASFGHPVWSFLCDCKMFLLMLTGRMDREIKRLGKRPMLQEDEYMVGRRYPGAKQETRVVLRRQAPWAR